MTDQTTTKDQIAAHLFQKLTACAEDIRQGGAMTDEQVTCAFMGVAVTIAAHSFGPVGAAEWLRDAADEIERDSFPLNGPLQ